MRTFECRCGSRVFFENSLCTKCQAELGFFPAARTLAALDTADAEGWVAGPGGGRARKCERYGWLCNWMVDEADGAALCRACRLNQLEPQLAPVEGSHSPSSDSGNQADEWQTMERAKRRLLFTLYSLGLDVQSKAESETGVAFALAANDPADPEHPVMTGHDDGLITLNLAEANPIAREQTRLSLGENYRTVLGHFRHESGHYFWDRLVDGQPCLEEFRALFGDERADYEAALKKHYESPASFDANVHVTPYATMHPWEDFAETWAHYLHLVDTGETARAFGIQLPVPTGDSPDPFQRKMAEWVELMLALNSLNRSMGQPDAYPFAIGPKVAEKLAFVERLIEAARAQPAIVSPPVQQRAAS